MRVSDANPIQFWPADSETFNEKSVCGKFQECFCQQFECGSDIRIQIDSADTSTPLVLNIYDSNNVLVDSLLFDPMDGYYELVFNPSEDLSPQVITCGEKYRFTIETGRSYILSASTAEMSLTGQAFAYKRNYQMSVSNLYMYFSMQSATLTYIHCEPGYEWNGSECIPICPPGYSWNGSACVDGNGCIEGCTWNGFECVCL